ncbi:hypothetical protein D3C86_2046900 [compost metagenome]
MPLLHVLIIFKSPPRITPDFITQEAVAISICVSPEAGIITSFAWLTTALFMSKFVLEKTS